MALQGWYYLHENGSLIYKPDPDACSDIRDSDFAKGLWPMDPADRANAWRIVVEGLAAGADPKRVAELAQRWACDDKDAVQYATHLGIVLKRDGNAWCAHRSDFENTQESPVGFGDEAYQAFADLAKQLGYRPSKMWGPEFSKLVQRPTGHDEGEKG